MLLTKRLSPSLYASNKAYFEMFISLSESCSSLCFAEQVQMRETLHNSVAIPFDPKIDYTNKMKDLQYMKNFHLSLVNIYLILTTHFPDMLFHISERLSLCAQGFFQ